MKLYLSIFGAFIVAVSSLNIKCADSSDERFVNSDGAKTVYHCPMNCEGDKTYDQPGKCPVCKMALEKINVKKESEKGSVKISGTMANVMHKGELYGTIDLDTIANKEHLYGIGPVEFLTAEITIADGIPYVSSVAKDGSIAMKESYKEKAPFFVYANIEKWKEIKLAEDVQTLTDLESFLDSSTKDHVRPFAFRMEVTIDSAQIHIVDLPPGTVVKSPDDAHKGQKPFSLANENVELIGFFSTEHQGVFTHHDTFLHVHLITSDKKKMGHLDSMILKKGSAKLFVPAE
ncbi:hypothetical protein BH10BAC5_BH10BAC5_27480 [soil metagenome]